MGLLLLRLAVALLAVAQGAADVREPGLVAVASGATSIVAGASLAAGALTPLAAGLVVLTEAARALDWVPRCVTPGPIPCAFAAIVALALALLGPGAFSVDCHLFGRRLIEIPADRKTPRG